MTWVVSMAVSTVVSAGEMTDLVFIVESTDSTTSAGEITTSYVGRQKTVVQSPDSQLIIDYQELQLVEYRQGTGKCYTYPLLDIKDSAKDFSPEDRFRREMAQQLGRAEVETTTGGIETGGLREVEIHWGRRVNLHRTFVSPSVTVYGRLFTVGQDLYLVNDKYADLDVLLDYGRMRDSILRMNPLLRRLDISAQVSILNGVPVQKTQKNGVVEKFSNIQKGSVYSYPPVPDACRQ